MLNSRRVSTAGPANTTNQPHPEAGPLRVLVVAARFLPDLGGTEIHVDEIARRIAKCSGFQLTVLTTDRSGTRPEREAFEGFTVLRCRSYPRNRDYYFAPGVYKRVMSGNYDIVHCQGVHTAVPVLAMMAARRKRIPYVVTLHTGGHSSDLRRRLRKAQWRLLAPLLRGAAIIVAVSRFEQRLFHTLCCLDVTRFRIIRNGGDLLTDGRQQKMIPGRIVSSGRLERYKGHQRLIEALPIIQRSIPEATLHILGTGPYEHQLRSLANALGLQGSVTIEYISPNNRDRMSEALSQAAVAAVLSEYEAHPLAIMEALAHGIPTVGLDSTGIADLVEEGVVEGVPKNASPTVIARILVAALEGHSVSASAHLPTWDIAATNIARVYVDAARAAPTR
jgi:glycosyltransferase involved in cell wall biosynthesis